MTVKPEFINPFVTAAAEVLRAEAGAEVSRGGLTLHNSGKTTRDVTTLISLVGDVEGVVLYCMDEPMCLGLISQMMGEECTEFDEMAQSGVGELGNVMSGRAAMKLSELGLEAQISPPTLIVGRGASVSTLSFQRLVVPLETQFGTMETHLALRQK